MLTSVWTRIDPIVPHVSMNVVDGAHTHEVDKDGRVPVNYYCSSLRSSLFLKLTLLDADSQPSHISLPPNTFLCSDTVK